MQNKEIELKFLINKQIKDKILTDLKTIAKFLETEHQIDTYYIPYYRNFELNGETNECLRIRESNGKIVMCYKKIHRDCTPVYCDEFETELTSKTQMENILLSLGFSIQMVIDKTRETYAYKNLEFDFDSVNNELELLEVELKDDSEDTAQIYNFVAKYGLSPKDVTYRGIQMLVKDLNKK